MHCIPRNVSVRPHQVSHCVRTFDAVLRNNFVLIFYTMHIFIQLFIRLLQLSNAFYKSSFCLNYYSTLLYGGDRLQQLFVSFSVFASHQYCFCVVKICGHCVHTKHKKSKKCFAPHKVEDVLTPVV